MKIFANFKAVIFTAYRTVIDLHFKVMTLLQGVCENYNFKISTKLMAFTLELLNLGSHLQRIIYFVTYEWAH
jgi:hypothetical protein